VLVGAAEILGRDPLAAPPHLQLAGNTRRTRLATGVMHLDPAARDRLAERARLDREVCCAGIAHQYDADLGGAVHAARGTTEGLLDEGSRRAVDRLAREGELFDRVAMMGSR